MSEKPELSDIQKSIFDSISKNDASALASYLAQYKDSVDIIDENGITPLQHAAYKGNKEMVQALLDRGADVNSGKHEYNYSALHFGALSGNSEVCRLLLDAGAKATATNTVGRTASQMAAFVGNHHTVSTINNYVHRNEVAYYSNIQGQQKEPSLPLRLVDKVQKFILEVNIHPVYVALSAQKKGLIDDANIVRNVLELMCKREMTKGPNTNEIISFKYHYLAYILKEINLIKEKSSSKDIKKDEENKYIVEIFAKKLLKPGKDGVSLDMMDVFLKECVREFPYRECTSFQQMVATLSNKDSPPALSVINSTINGQRGFVDSIVYCSTCGEERPPKKCAKCKRIQYCDRECQRLHWFVHKKMCSREGPETSSQNIAKEKIDTSDLSQQLQNLIAG